jgi:hypothetical protein
MPRKKLSTPLTYGYLPSALTPTKLVDMCKGRVKPELVMLFFKYLLNRSTVRYEKVKGQKKQRYIGQGAPDIRAEVEVHSDYLEKLFGHLEAPKYKQFLMEQGLVEIINYHGQTGLATRYRICWDNFQHELFGGTKIYRKVPIYDKRSYNAERNLYALRKAKSLRVLAPEYQQLVTVLETLRLDLTSPKATALVDTFKLNHAMSSLSDYTYLEFLEAVDGRDIEYYFVDPFGTRFHTIFTTLMKGIRELLYFTDKPTEKLVSLDIVNSQPWLTAAITPEIIEKYVPAAVPFIPYIKVMQFSDDYDRYRTLCLNGRIYEHWISVLEREIGVYWREEIADADRAKAAKLTAKGKKVKQREPIDSPNLTDRQAAKTCMYRVIFGKEGKQVGPLHQAFRAEWPSVATCFQQIKKLRIAESPSKKVYANLCLIMQRLESEVMLRFISAFFANGINHLVTIFDGVLVLESQRAEARKLMLEVIASMQLDLPQIGE